MMVKWLNHLTIIVNGIFQDRMKDRLTRVTESFILNETAKGSFLTDTPPIHQSSENRRFGRRQLVYYLKVYETETKDLAGFLGDISKEGLMLFRSDPIESGQIFSFTIDLAKEFGMDEDLVFDARSVWCEPDANPDYHAVGFKFVDLPQPGLDMVVYLMEKIGFV